MTERARLLDRRPSQTFDDVAENISEIVDAILSEERSRDRRLQLILHHVRRALSHGYKAGLARASKCNEAVSENRDSREEA